MEKATNMASLHPFEVEHLVMIVWVTVSPSLS
jgi:hypothetical protein